jgi:disulfide bond formation protein DsbB
MKRILKDYSLYAAWFVSLIAMLGSLYFSNVRGFPPCVLCWYQRICLYPLVLIIPIGIIKKDKNIYSYVLGLSGIGFLIGLYHNLLYYNIIPEAAAPCVNGVSCTTKFIEYFGFLTIPLLSLIAFATIIVLMLANRKLNKDV